jgi:lipopolysaccharide assembly protein A
MGGQISSPAASRPVGGPFSPWDSDQQKSTIARLWATISFTAGADQERFVSDSSIASIASARPGRQQKGVATMTRLMLVGLLLLLSLAFFLQNQEQEVTLRYFFGLLEASTPIYKPILAGFVVGLLVAAILLFPPWVRSRIDLRRKTKALQEAEVDLERLRQSLDKLSGRPASSTQVNPSRNPADE